MLEGLELLPEERKTIESLIKFGVFKKVVPKLLDRRYGIVNLGCSDCDQFEDRYLEQCRHQLACRPDPRIHPITLNGGVLACAMTFSVNKHPTTADEILNQIHKATAMKSIVGVVLEGHAPCGVARDFGLSIERQLNLQMEVYGAVKALGRPNIDVANHFHVSYSNAEKKTSFFDYHQWPKWLEIYGTRIHA